MFKLKILFLILFLSIWGDSKIWAQNFSNPIIYSGLETLTFKNGESPTTEYAGLFLTHISGIGAPTNFYDGAGDTVSILGYSNRLLFKADISAIPDSAIIERAELWLLQRGGNASGFNDHDDNVIYGVYRMMRDWDAGTTTWAIRSDSVGAAWAGNGAADSIGTISVWGAAATIFRNGINYTRSAWTTRATRHGYIIGWGPDSLSHGYNMTTNFMDRTINPQMSFGIAPIPQTLTTIGEFWIRIDLTEMCRYWHNNYWKNYGAMIKPILVYQDGVGFLEDTNISNLNHTIDIPNTRASAKTEPFLIIRYLYAVSETSAGGVGGNQIGEGSGIR